MGGFFGTVAKESCVTDLFYGTDYNSHLGTKRTIWKVPISVPSLKTNWTSLKETPA